MVNYIRKVSSSFVVLTFNFCSNSFLLFFFTYIYPDDCTLTRSSDIIEKYFYQVPYVNVGFFISTWFVALFFVLALIYSVCRKPRKGTFNEFDSLDFEDDNE